MSVGSGKNVHNEKAVGLSEQLCECKRRRGGGAESATGEDPRRKAGIADARKEGRGLAPLKQARVGAFIDLYLMAMVNIENAHRYGYQSRASAKMLNKTLVKRIIPWINRNRVWTRDESQWPITLEQFIYLFIYLFCFAWELRI